MAIDQVQKGERLSTSLRGCPELFPATVLEMVAVAEETGRLDKEFVRVAAASERQLDGKLRTSVALAEPLVLFFIAAFIGLIFHRDGNPHFLTARLHQMTRTGGRS